MLTQNLFAMSGPPSTDEVQRWLLLDERVARHPAPRRDVGAGARVEGDEPEPLARRHRGDTDHELQDEIAAAKIPSVPLDVGGAARPHACAPPTSSGTLGILAAAISSWSS